MKEVKILGGCAAAILSSSILVIVVSFLYHPSRSEPSNQVEYLSQIAQCLLCQKYPEDKCPENCLNDFSERNGMQENCILTDKRRKLIEHVIKNELKTDVHHWKKTTLQHPYDFERKMETLARDVPRPSAHWYLPRKYHPKLGGSSTKFVNLDQWEHKTGRFVAHSVNGIKFERGGMKIGRDGWYFLYVQVDFKSFKEKKRSRFILNVEAQGETDEEKIDLISMESNPLCNPHESHSSHTCVVLRKSGMFKLRKDHLVKVMVEMPAHASIDKTPSRTYFGAYFVRSVD